jgi:hypothetical protein
MVFRLDRLHSLKSLVEGTLRAIESALWSFFACISLRYCLYRSDSLDLST